MLRIGRITELAHHYLELSVKKGDLVIDATAGNGFDTLFLADAVGKNGHVYAFDIQSDALAATEKKLLEKKLAGRVTLINDGHEKLDLYVRDQVAAVIYNLGYLPGGNKEKTTKYDTTISSLEKALRLLTKNGLVVIVLYPGHGEGKVEKVQLLKYCSKLPPRSYNVLLLSLVNQPNEPPELLIIQRNLFSLTADV